MSLKSARSDYEADKMMELGNQQKRRMENIYKARSKKIFLKGNLKGKGIWIIAIM
jgi:hypothetical protein